MQQHQLVQHILQQLLVQVEEHYQMVTVHIITHQMHLNVDQQQIHVELQDVVVKQQRHVQIQVVHVHNIILNHQVLVV